MKHIIYKYSLHCFLTAQLTKRIEAKLSILYPSTKFSIINRTAEYLIRIYLTAILAVVGMFLFADFSIYYTMVSVMVVYVMVNAKVYGDLERLEMKLLKQLEKFLADVKFRFQFDGMLEEALQDAINYAEYEMSIQGEKMLECLKNHYRADNEDYAENAPNQFFLTLYSICLMTLIYGDKKVDGQSLFVKNLGYLKQEVSIEQLKRRKIQNEFMGLLGLTILPIFAVKPIERWALSNMPQMRDVYYGMEGTLTTIALAVFTIAVYQGIIMLRKINSRETYKNQTIKRLAEQETINRILLWMISHRRGHADKMNRLLRETGYSYSLTEYMLLQIIWGFVFFIAGIIVFWSIGIRKGIIPAAIICFFLGHSMLYLGIIIRRQILIMGREEEIVRFQTIILMIMYNDRMTVEELLRRMEVFAQAFKENLYELTNLWSYKGFDCIRDAKGKTGFHPYEKLLDSLLACDTMPIYRAFEDVESDRSYYVEKHRQDNEDLIEKKALIAKTIAFLPLCLVIILKLIVPFVVQGLQGFDMSMGGL